MAAKVGVAVAEALENAAKHKLVKVVTVHGVAVAEAQASAVDNSTYT